MDKIAIIGIPGGGKSTFATKLGQKLNRPVVHLDKELFTTDWKKRHSDEEWKDFQKNLVKQKQWIIDGNHKGSMDIRLNAADTVIFLDINKWLCAFRVVVRAFKSDSPIVGFKQKVELKLIKTILTYPRQDILQKLNKLGKGQRVFILRNPNEVEAFLNSDNVAGL